MVVVSSSIPSLSSPPLSIPPILKSKSLLYHSTNSSIQSSLYFPIIVVSPPPNHHCIIPPRSTGIRRVSLSPDGLFLLSEANPPENSEQVAAVSGDGVSTVISVLLFIAFAGLSILTIGVIYIAISDYLQKREAEKFEKEEAENAKKGGKKKRVRARARAGPRGFGQKIEEDDDD